MSGFFVIAMHLTRAGFRRERPKLNPNLDQAIVRLGDPVPCVGDSFAPLTDEDIQAIEHRLGRPLDPAHRDLLLRFGACTFADEVTFEPAHPLPKSYSKSGRGFVESFLGKLNEKYPRARKISILHNLEILEDELPADFLPVAAVGQGDLYGIRGDGTVWLWIHDARQGKALHRVTDTFADWLGRLEN
jgi:hypothetical protein